MPPKQTAEQRNNANLWILESAFDWLRNTVVVNTQIKDTTAGLGDIKRAVRTHDRYANKIKERLDGSRMESDVLQKLHRANLVQIEDLQDVTAIASSRGQELNSVEIADIKVRKERVWQAICNIFAEETSALGVSPPQNQQAWSPSLDVKLHLNRYADTLGFVRQDTSEDWKASEVFEMFASAMDRVESFKTEQEMQKSKLLEAQNKNSSTEQELDEAKRELEDARLKIVAWEEKYDGAHEEVKRERALRPWKDGSSKDVRDSLAELVIEIDPLRKRVPELEKRCQALQTQLNNTEAGTYDAAIRDIITATKNDDDDVHMLPPTAEEVKNETLRAHIAQLGGLLGKLLVEPNSAVVTFVDMKPLEVAFRGFEFKTLVPLPQAQGLGSTLRGTIPTFAHVNRDDNVKNIAANLSTLLSICLSDTASDHDFLKDSAELKWLDEKVLPGLVSHLVTYNVPRETFQ